MSEVKGNETERGQCPGCGGAFLYDPDMAGFYDVVCPICWHKFSLREKHAKKKVCEGCGEAEAVTEMKLPRVTLNLCGGCNERGV